MKITGRSTIDAPPHAVFAAICDPEALLEVIPGCEQLLRISADEYRGRIVLRLPAIVGRYDTKVRLLEAEPPLGGSLEGRVTGRAGSVVGRATFRLAPDGPGTLVEYAGEGIVTGPLARLDSRFIEGLAETLIDEGLARLGRCLGSRKQIGEPVG